jgi:hypothetical protein
VYVIKIDALYNLHATLKHIPYRRIERMILKGLWNGYSFDWKLLKQHVNIYCDIYMSAKLTDESHTGNLHRYDQDTGTLFTTIRFSYGPWVVDPLNMERYNAVHVYLFKCRSNVTVLLSDLPGGVTINAPKDYYRWQHHHSLKPQALKLYSSFHTTTTRNVDAKLTKTTKM